MRLGLISDIHADYAALERAFAVLERRGADRVVCMGDVVEKGPDGDRVVRALQANLVATVRGNHDENAVRLAREPVAAEASDEPLEDATLRYLASLPDALRYVWEGVRVELAHGIPGAVDTYVFPEHIPKRFKRVVRSLEADVLLLGHTHRPMRARVGELWVLNPGSVAGSRSRDSHTCAILSLPSLAFAVYSLDDGSEVPLAAPDGGSGSE